MKPSSFFRSQIFYISLLLTFVATVFFIRCYWHEPMGDELFYEFVWEEGDTAKQWSPDHRYERRVENLSDIIQTQRLHYMLVNGRSLVHAGEQAFTGHQLAFSIVQTILFILFIYLLTQYIEPSKERRDSYPLWFFITAVLIFLFPQPYHLWTSINFGPNYLWPAIMTVLIFRIWQKIENGTLSNRYDILVAILAFIFGWSHEGFVVGVAGGIFIYYCIYHKKFKRQLLWLVIPMYIAAAIMIFAPGNLHRFFGSSDEPTSIKTFLITGAINLTELWLIWILLLGFIIVLCFGNKQRLFAFINENIKLILILAVGFVFSMLANTTAQSFILTELISFILIFKYLCSIGIFKTKASCIIGAILSVLFVFQQSVLAADNIRYYEFQHRMCENYKKSQDGLVLYDEPSVSFASKPLLTIWSDPQSPNRCLFNVICGTKDKTPNFLRESDICFVENPDLSFNPGNKIPGDAPAYHKDGGDWIWFNPRDLSPDSKINAEYYPVDWHHSAPPLVKLKFALFPGSYSNKEILKIDTINTRFGESYRVGMPSIRKIKSINFVD